MATNKYYSESELVQKKQDGEFGWLDYVENFRKLLHLLMIIMVKNASLDASEDQ